MSGSFSCSVKTPKIEDIVYALASGWVLEPHENTSLPDKRHFTLLPANKSDERRTFGTKYETIIRDDIVIAIPHWFDTDLAPLKLCL